MKKVLLVIILVCVCCSTVFAGSFRIQKSDILGLTVSAVGAASLIVLDKIVYPTILGMYGEASKADYAVCALIIAAGPAIIIGGRMNLGSNAQVQPIVTRNGLGMGIQVQL